ncbi:MFS general substrate transporter [Violaceomyces palustris]|uniref:MFS general substrate transporter n=1 Tax=Violaceomyces palustris TaxID=1673888 RepID=A0ACD0NTL4_9BASI|nr:MFS general substrate transporter [Violaceomyces palustris]
MPDLHDQHTLRSETATPALIQVSVTSHPLHSHSASHPDLVMDNAAAHQDHHHQRRSADFTMPRHSHHSRPRFLRAQSSSLSFTLGTGTEGEDPEIHDWRSTARGETPLDRTMDQIGMGRYQWSVLVLSGLGWAADNMWIQAVAIILPHMQRSFEISDSLVGLASSSIFLGMFVGSLAWGSYSDAHGRTAAFNITLLVATIFGTLSAVSTSFPMLCFLLFFVGTGVGGSMPTDGSNLLENLPVRKHSYVTALSVFFAAGSVVSSVTGLIVLPGKDVSGWRWLLGFLGLTTALFFVARVVFFRILESPKFLVHSGRKDEAKQILQRIQKFNGGEPMNLRPSDVVDDLDHVRIVEPADAVASDPTGPSPGPVRLDCSSQLNIDTKTYQTIGSDPPLPEVRENIHHAEDHDQLLPSEHSQDQGVQDQGSSIWLPRVWTSLFFDLSMKYAELFSDEWKRTTTLIWIIWGGMSFAFTMFNVFLPKLLQDKYGNPGSDTSGDSRKAMEDYLFYSASSLPGSLISAYLVETRLGRIGTMAFSTGFTALSVLLFSIWSIRLFLVVISISSSISYAAIYGYTPEVMGPRVRATGCGSASAISRLTGILAPLVAGWLYAVSTSLPLYLSVATFSAVALAMAMLPIETRGRSNEATP